MFHESNANKASLNSQYLCPNPLGFCEKHFDGKMFHL